MVKKRLIFCRRHESHWMYLLRLYSYKWKDYLFGAITGCLVAWFVVYSVDARADTGYENAVACVALNIYHEAKFQPYEGRKAVAFVTITRMVKSGADICKVVFARRQFSWSHNALDGGKLKPEFVPKNSIHWRKAQYVARMALSGEISNPFPGATHYHANYVKPHWAKGMHFLGQIGNHLFYREAK